MVLANFAALLDEVRLLGRMALARQRELTHRDRERKRDGSVVTAVDREVEARLAAAIAGLFPGCGIVAEEQVRDWDASRPLTFAIDPIDGTDTFSQGLPGWCISVGVLDHGLRPVAGIVLAPALELELAADAGARARHNGHEVAPPELVPVSSSAANLMVSSRGHRDIDLARFPGKIRSLGSAALHICLPFVLPAVVGAFQGPSAHIWDIAGAHAIALSLGGDLQPFGGGRVDYARLTSGESVGEILLGGYPGHLGELRRVLAGGAPSGGPGP
jgi:fructose-1,6-bisphosphatase/inositol monophosphatase family enzyme